MNKKSLTAFILAVVTVLALGLSVACTTETPVELENFEDVTVDADLGTAYALPSPVVYDKEGNEYTVTYTVKTASGADVKVFNNQFTLLKVENYLITCTATITEKDVRTRTITIRVKDTGKPVIKFGEAKTGYVGKEYTLPEVTIADASGETITPEIKLYLVDGENKTEVTVANGKFTPATRGTYSMEVTAKDSSNNTAEEKIEFYVRAAVGENKFEDFDDEYGKYALTNKENGVATDDAEWLEEFEGKTGVIAAKSTKAYGPHQFFKFNMTTEELAAIDFEYVYADIYVTYENEGKLVDKDLKFYTWNREIATGKTGEWMRLKITNDVINDANSQFSFLKLGDETPRETFNRVMTTGIGTYLFYTLDSDSVENPAVAGRYTVYIDELGWKPVYNIEMNLESEYALGEYVTFNATVANLSDYTMAYDVTAPSGKKVEVDSENKIRLMEGGKYTVKASIVHATAEGEETFTFTVTSDKEFVVENFTASGTQFEEITVPAATFDGNTVQPIVKIGVTAITLTEGKFVAEMYGTYTVEYAYDDDGLVYRETKEIAVAKGASKANEVESFSGADSANNIKAVVPIEDKNHNVEWLYEFEGEKGVVKMTQQGATWPAFTFFANQPMATYADYDYLVVRAFFPSDVDTYTGFALGVTNAQYHNDIEKGKWVDIVYNINTFLDNWKDDRTKMDLSNARIWSWETSNKVELYLADIRVVKDVKKSGIVIEAKSAYDAPVAGKDLVFEVKNGENLNYTFEVTDPEGNKVELTDGKTTAIKGVYTYKLTCEGYLGEITGTVEVFEGLAVIASDVENAGKVGDEIAVPTPKIVYQGKETNEATVTVTVKYGNEDVTFADGKFTAAYSGVYTVNYAVEIGGESATKTITLKVMENGALAVFDHASKLDTLIGNDFAKEFIDATKIAADETLPALPEGATGYLKLTGKSSNEYGTFNVGFKGDYFTAADIKDSDYIEFTIRFASEKTHRVYYFNRLLGTYEGGKWVTVRMPVAMFSQTENVNESLSTIEQFYACITTRQLFVIWDWSATENETAYIAGVKLVKEAAHTELGDKWVDFNKENWQDIFKAKGGTIEWSDEYNGVYAKDSGGWVNVYVKTERKFSELHNYSKLRVTCKNVGENVGIFVQNNFMNTSEEAVYLVREPGENGIVYFDMPIETLMKYYYKTYYGGNADLDNEHRALLIGNANGNFVITAIELVK